MRTTIVVPVYNEKNRLDLVRFQSFADKHPGIEFLFVDDGSSDHSAEHIESFLGARTSSSRLVRQSPNQGKGAAIRLGVLTALQGTPDYIGYWDADLATPLESIPEFLTLFTEKEDAYLVMGSRVKLLGRDIERQTWRHYLGRVFATCASLVLKLPVYDTQCGAKIFKVQEQTQRVFQNPFLSRWLFDVELLARFLCEGKRSAKGIYELPLQRWHDIKGSKVNAMAYIRSALDLWKIHRKYGKALGGPNTTTANLDEQTP